MDREIHLNSNSSFKRKRKTLQKYRRIRRSREAHSCKASCLQNSDDGARVSSLEIFNLYLDLGQEDRFDSSVEFVMMVGHLVGCV